MLKTVKNLGAFEYFIPNADNPRPLQNLLDLIVNDLGFSFFNTVDRTKINLSDNTETIFDFPLPHDHIKEQITRSDFESLISNLVEDSEICIKRITQLGRAQSPKYRSSHPHWRFFQDSPLSTHDCPPFWRRQNRQF